MKTLRSLGWILVMIVGIAGIIGSSSAPQQPAPIRLGGASNQFFNVAVRGQKDSFLLTIQNRTSQDLEIDWNKTLFIESGTTSGGFMFEGVVYTNRSNPKPPDVVFGRSEFTKTIYPNKLVSFTSGKYGGWNHDSITYSATGVYLTIKVGSEEIKEKILVN